MAKINLTILPYSPAAPAAKPVTIQKPVTKKAVATIQATPPPTIVTHAEGNGSSGSGASTESEPVDYAPPMAGGVTPTQQNSLAPSSESTSDSSGAQSLEPTTLNPPEVDSDPESGTANAPISNIPTQNFAQAANSSPSTMTMIVLVLGIALAAWFTHK